MPSYSAEFKEHVVRKLMPPSNRTVASVSQEIGVSEATLYNWKKQFRAQGYVVPQKPSIADQWDAKAKLAAVIQTAMMNEVERSEYCRQHGLYSEQIEAWKEAFESFDTAQGSVTDKAELAAERKKSRALEKELNRKEKALAEVAALLTLSKKSAGHLGYERGRLIPLEMKQMALTLIDEAMSAGARQSCACVVLGVSDRTVRRWRGADCLADRRKGADRRPCSHALTPDEKEAILATCNRVEHQNLPPSQLVPRLADQGIYLTSESAF